MPHWFVTFVKEPKQLGKIEIGQRDKLTQKASGAIQS